MAAAANLQAPTRSNWFDTLALSLLVLLTVDLTLFGPGMLLPVVGMSMRRLLFMGVLGMFLLRYILAARGITLSQLLLPVLIAFIVVLWTVAIPSAYGFSRGDSLADMLPWTMLLLLAFWPWDAWPDIARWKSYCRFVVLLTVVLAGIHILVWALVVAGVLTNPMIALITNRLGGGDPSDDSFIKIAGIGESGIRVYWTSSIFMFCGLYFHMVDADRKKGFQWWLIFAVLTFGLWITHIRAFLGAVVIFLVLPHFLRLLKSPLLSGRSAAAVLLIWIGFIASTSVAMNPQMLELVGLARDVSDVVRVDQAEALLNAFSAHPLLGTGFGSYSTALVRSESLFSYELVFYALLMKLGLVGIVVLVAALFFTLDLARVGRFAQLQPVRHSYWVAFTAGFWFAGSTNPLVLNFVGMGVLLLLLIDSRYFSGSTPAC